jgi:threonine/homoserine/homoserine lactone efflux protein
MEFLTWLSLVSTGFLVSISPRPRALFTMIQSSQLSFKPTLISVAGLPDRTGAERPRCVDC